MSLAATAWRVAEPMAKFAREMGVIAKATGEGDLAQRLACSQRRPAMQKVRGVIQTKRVYEFATGRTARPGPSKLKPVTLPPGLARLATKPRPTGLVLIMTMGMVVVCCRAALAC